MAALVEGANRSGEFLILCDHASSFVPKELGGLGLAESVIYSHAGWDIGALDCARGLAHKTNSPLVFSGVSRLVIDCNRNLNHPELIVETTEFGLIPGNLEIAPHHREDRVGQVHRPFHATVEKLVQARKEGGLLQAVISVHSFTPVYAGARRPWHVGILYRSCDVWALEVKARLESCPGVKVGLNVPYSGLTEGVFYSLDRHAESHGIPCLMFELRNDMIRNEVDQTAWAHKLADALLPLPESRSNTSICEARR